MTGYSSADFGEVGGSLRANLPERLKHAAVLGGQDGRSENFSRERKHMVKLVDLPTKSISMTLGGLGPGQASGRHRHNYESVIYVLEGRGRTLIEDREVTWEAGDAIYVPVWAWHQHFNADVQAGCLYLACENAPLLQNLGNIALREEAP